MSLNIWTGLIRLDSILLFRLHIQTVDQEVTGNPKYSKQQWFEVAILIKGMKIIVVKPWLDGSYPLAGV